MVSKAFGNIRTLPATDRAKTEMKKLVAQGLFREQGDVWRLGAALGIALGKVSEKGKRETFQNINSLDPEGILSAIMVGRYPDMDQDKRAKKLVDHAEWGIEEIYHAHEIGTLDFSKLGLISSDVSIIKGKDIQNLDKK